MALRAYYEQENTEGIINRVEIDVADFTGTALELGASKSGFEFRHDEITSENSDGIIFPYANLIQGGTLDFFPRIQTDNEKTFLNDIVGNSNKDVLLTWKQDGSTFWKGYVHTEKVRYPEKAVYYGQIRASDFRILQSIDYLPSGALPTGRVTIAEIIADLLGYLDFDYSIEAATSLVETNITENENFLHQIYADKYNLRQYNKAIDDSAITVYEALKKICNAPLIIRQIGGKFQVHQISAFQDPENVIVTTYDSDGLNPSTSTVDFRQTVYKQTSSGNPTAKNVSVNEIYPGVKRAEVRFDHRTIVNFIDFDNLFPSITLSGANADTQTADQLIITDGTQSLELHGTVKATGLNGSTDMKCRIGIFIEPSAGGDDYYWDGEGTSGSVGWVNNGTAYYNDIFLQQDGDVAYKTFTIKTGDLPAAADGTLNVFFDYAISQDLSPNLPADTTEYYGLEFDVKNPSVEDGNNRAIDFRATQVKGYQTVLKLPDSWFGDGPTSYSVARLTTDSAGSSATADTWGRRGATYNDNFHIAALKEIMDLQRRNVIKLGAEMTKDYDPEKVSVYG